MFPKRHVFTLVMAGTIAALAGRTTSAYAQSDAAKFYAGKQIDFIVGAAPGGGYGIYATVLARHYGQHVPGKPTIVARNLDGAGSLIAANLLYNKSPRDGLTIGAIFMGAVVEPLIGDTRQTHFDPRNFNFIGSANRESSICLAWHTAPVQSFPDVLQKELIVGGAGVTSSIRQYPGVLNKVMGTKFKIISGYSGSHTAALAMEKGETNGLCGIQWSSFISHYQNWLDAKKVHIFVQIASPAGDPTLNKMGIPKIWDYVKNDEDRKTLEVIFSQLDFGRPYITPPNVPADRVAALRAAFDATMKDPEFLKDAAKAKLDINPLPGEEVQKLVANVYASPKDAVERARAALK